MSGSLFTPKVYPKVESTTKVTLSGSEKDKLALLLKNISQFGIVALLFLLPIFFSGGPLTYLGFDKVVLVAVIIAALVIMMGLSALRYRSVKTTLPLVLILFWAFSLAAVTSALLSGDVQDSLRGSLFEPQTAGFFVLLASLMTIPLILQDSKKSSFRAILAFAVAAVLVIGYSFLRLFLEPGSLSFDIFLTISNSPLGGFNDLAIFCALVVMLILITFLHFEFKRFEKLFLMIVLGIGLAILSVVNFFHLWLVLGFFSLLLLVYVLSRDTLFIGSDSGEKKPVPAIMVMGTIMVCLVSCLFIVAGDYFGTKVSDLTNVSYVEVRPSMSATLDITRAVYSENILLGTGPNRFVDAWRMHKDRNINETVFWNTDFTAGFGFVPTIFVTTGLLGGVLLVIFHLFYLSLGYRMLLKNEVSEPFWYYFAVVSFTAATFLWGMSYIYIPGAAILLLASLFTGLSLVAYAFLIPKSQIEIPLVNSRRRGFVVMALVIITIVSTVTALFSIINQYSAQRAFAEASVAATTAEEFETLVNRAFIKYQDDLMVGALAQSKLLSLRQTLIIPEPSIQDQEFFINTAAEAIALGERAVALDPTSPAAYGTIADILAVLAAANLEGAKDRAWERLAEAQSRDPHNPSYNLFGATLAVQTNDLDKARAEISKALDLKNNYTQALFLLTQIDINEGKIEDALANTRQIIALEPNNPTRHYQLGLLLAASNDLAGAITAYERAISLDQNFANAKYMLALAYLDSNRLDDALEQLRAVRVSNPENETLNQLINQLETGGIESFIRDGVEEPVNEISPNQEDQSAVVIPVDAGTDLVTPVNTPNQDSSDSQSITN